MFISKKELEKRLDRSWQDGFEIGRKKVVPEVKKVYVKLLTQEIKEVSEPMMVDKEYLDGLERAIEIVRKGKR